MRWTVLLIVSLIVAGCSSAPDHTPAPHGVGPSADRAGAPPITLARDLAPRAADPCGTLMNEAQVRSLRLDTPGRPRTTAAGSPACSWRAGALGLRVDAAVVLRGDLFVDTYRRRFLPVFEPLTVAGSPAVDLRSTPDSLTCTTTVGVADGESLDVGAAVRSTATGRPASDPCEEGHRVAEAIVSALPPK